MKKILFVTAILLSFMPLALFGEVVNVVAGTVTTEGDPVHTDEYTFTKNSSTQTVHYQFIYPASLFEGTTHGSYKLNDNTSNQIFFEAIAGIKLYPNFTLPTGEGAVNNLGFKITAKAWTTTQNNYSSSSSFIDVPESAVTLCDNSGDGSATGKITIDATTITLENSNASLAWSQSQNVVVDILLTGNMINLTENTKDISWSCDDNKSNAAIVTTSGQSSESGQSSDVTNSVKNFLPKTDFVCGRVIKDVRITGTDYNATYDLHTTTGADYLATLKTCFVNSSNTQTASYQLTYSAVKAPESGPKTILRGQVLTLGDVNFQDANVASQASNVYRLNIIGNESGGPVFTGEVTSDFIYEIPSSVVQIGFESLENQCFSAYSVSTSSESHGEVCNAVTFYLNSYPQLLGNTTNLTNKSGSKQPRETNLFFVNNLDGEYAETTGWSDVPNGAFKEFGYASFFYNIGFGSKEYDLGSKQQKTGTATDGDYYSIAYPYNDTYKLEFNLNPEKKYRSYDGTDHYFTGFDNTNYENFSEPTYDGSKLTAGFSSTRSSNKCKLEVVSKFDARLEYQQPEDKDQMLDVADLGTYAPENQWLERANSLVFGKEKDNKSPEFEYTNKGTTGAPDDHLSTLTPLYVEKIIDNEQYQFFSMPFDVNIDDITVEYYELYQKSGDDWTKIDFNGMWECNNDFKLPILNSDFAEGMTIDNDRYVIYEYTGQDNVTGGGAQYAQVMSGTLMANKGYAFVIAESDNNYAKNMNGDDYELKYKVTAVIRFKDARGNNSKNIYINTFDKFQYTQASQSGSQTTSSNNNGLPGSAVTSGDKIQFPILFQSGPTDKEKLQNRNWNLVGNPFFHTVKGSAFGKYVTTIGADNANTTQESYVNKHVAHHSKYDNEKIPSIQPFQTFFIQADDVADEAGGTSLLPIEINPAENGDQSPSQSIAYAPVNDRTEVVSVNILLRDTVNDFTAVINADSRGREFRIGDDLGKMFNPCAQIFTYCDSVKCVFKELDVRNDSSLRIIPLGVRIVEEGDYTFAIDDSRHYFHGAVLLHDKTLNQYHNLNLQGTSQIHLTAGTDLERFELVLEPSEIPAGEEAIVGTSETLDAYVYDGRLVVENIEDGSTLSIFDASGRMLYSAPAAGSFDYDFGVRGVYMVVVSGNTTGSIKVVY